MLHPASHPCRPARLRTSSTRRRGRQRGRPLTGRFCDGHLARLSSRLRQSPVQIASCMSQKKHPLLEWVPGGPRAWLEDHDECL